jgi:hypothetical protein
MGKIKNCSICDAIGVSSYAIDTRGSEYEFVPLPPQVSELIPIDDLITEEGHGENEIVKSQKRQCPSCGQVYQYKSIMTYFSHFIENVEYLTRI